MGKSSIRDKLAIGAGLVFGAPLLAGALGAKAAGAGTAKAAAGSVAAGSAAPSIIPQAAGLTSAAAPETLAALQAASPSIIPQAAGLTSAAAPETLAALQAAQSAAAPSLLSKAADFGKDYLKAKTVSSLMAGEPDFAPTTEDAVQFGARALGGGAGEPVAEEKSPASPLGKLKAKWMDDEVFRSGILRAGANLLQEGGDYDTAGKAGLALGGYLSGAAAGQQAKLAREMAAAEQAAKEAEVRLNEKQYDRELQNTNSLIKEREQGLINQKEFTEGAMRAIENAPEQIKGIVAPLAAGGYEGATKAVDILQEYYVESMKKQSEDMNAPVGGAHLFSLPGEPGEPDRSGLGFINRGGKLVIGELPKKVNAIVPSMVSAEAAANRQTTKIAADKELLATRLQSNAELQRDRLQTQHENTLAEQNNNFANRREMIYEEAKREAGNRIATIDESLALIDQIRSYPARDFNMVFGAELNLPNAVIPKNFAGTGAGDVAALIDSLTSKQFVAAALGAGGFSRIANYEGQELKNGQSTLKSRISDQAAREELDKIENSLIKMKAKAADVANWQPGDPFPYPVYQQEQNAVKKSAPIKAGQKLTINGIEVVVEKIND